MQKCFNWKSLFYYTIKGQQTIYIIVRTKYCIAQLLRWVHRRPWLSMGYRKRAQSPAHRLYIVLVAHRFFSFFLGRQLEVAPFETCVATSSQLIGIPSCPPFHYFGYVGVLCRCDDAILFYFFFKTSNIQLFSFYRVLLYDWTKSQSS